MHFRRDKLWITPETITHIIQNQQYTITQHKSRCKQDFIHSAIICNQNFDNYDQCQDHFPWWNICYFLNVLNVFQYIHTQCYLTNRNMFFEIMSSFKVVLLSNFLAHAYNLVSSTWLYLISSWKFIPWYFC